MLPTAYDVLDAAKTLKGIAHKTPVHTSRTLDAKSNANVYLKCENFQRVGAFKFRGAYNAMSQLTFEEKRRGVITHSSGNHAQAVALVGALLDIKTTIVMPQDAPPIKLAATRSYGANVVLYDPNERTREEISAELKEQHGYVLIPPYDHPHIIAGQGTAALELVNDYPDLDALLVPCGGGGLLSGSALAAKHVIPNIKVIGVEPELANDATLSWRTGELHTVKNPPTIADGTRTPSLGKLTFPLVRTHVDDFVNVSETNIIDATKFLFERMKLVVEPSGALGIAALLNGNIKGERIGVIISGGNLDPKVLLL
ncbi:MAG: threo-3-hydroxy-L-aspartate ammonia-lyase [Calditrichaeota bacterium]|nr:threo-3-hydroxy-L-aspartate ammonia-lyase [Calditrichota bacterium]MCB9369095.1 threo-3-hydroxy-L-aspartate ammonia-lyase [Calditrichota bacterium]